MWGWRATKERVGRAERGPLSGWSPLPGAAAEASADTQVCRVKYGFRSRGREDPACSTSDSMGRATEGGVLSERTGNKTLRLNTLTKHKGGESVPTTRSRHDSLVQKERRRGRSGRSRSDKDLVSANPTHTEQAGRRHESRTHTNAHPADGASAGTRAQLGQG